MFQESTTFFAYFYLVVNLGSLVGITVIVYVEENISWACGFGLTGEHVARCVHDDCASPKILA